ncbi:LytTR family two component transcriptional regulator [Luteibacter rhizovicinus]|uniref:LytTR family two component transcriptional regulator n=1 Tax=Luteibacter rhizovicinus TaxID=242606 RepID=A0A4R3YQ09_9GAMM|nr:LytTR family DNA-binding domain-containing protein [Luteibacter rhizovicinus]TCV93274.1 LytTR family two component transcriptional regulator [Luteibacter rhizovicinus]
MTLRVVLVDDEAPARAKLRRYLDAVDEVVVVGEAGSGSEALAAIATHRPDVVFLDIGMPDMDGFELLQALGDPLPAEIVFVTAHGDYALQAFEVHAFDYLLKPVSPERFDRLVHRLKERLTPRADMGGRIDRLLDALPAPAHFAEHLLVEAEGRAGLLPVDGIGHIEADRNYLVVHAERGRYRLRGTVERMQARLDPAKFVRVNRSTLVRLATIKEVAPWPGGEYRLVLDDGSRLTWTRRYVDQVPPSLLMRV